MNAIGPVEPVVPGEPFDNTTSSEGFYPGPTADPDAPHEVLGTEPPRPANRWLRVLLTTAAAAVVTVAAAVSLTHHPQGTPAPVPSPGRITHLSYQGLSGAPDPAARTFALRIKISVDSGSPVTVESVRHPYPSLTTTTQPAAPFEIGPQRSREATLRITVRSCSATPLGVALPFLNVTLRNSRALQRETVTLNRAYAKDLSAALDTICRSSAQPPDTAR